MTAADHPPVTEGPVDPVIDYSYYWWDEINMTTVTWQGKPNTDWTVGGTFGKDVD